MSPARAAYKNGVQPRDALALGRSSSRAAAWPDVQQAMKRAPPLPPGAPADIPATATVVEQNIVGVLMPT
jgi:hypothetical protein